MNYLLDRKAKRKRNTWIGIFAGIIIFIYFGSAIFGGFSYATHFIFRPILVLGKGIWGKFGGVGAYFSSKGMLTKDNEKLRGELDAMSAKVANYNTLADENIQLKEILGRKQETANLVLSSILAKPNQTLYDTLIIDTGSNNAIQVGNTVFAYSNVPIGVVSEVYGKSSKVTLYSSSGVKTNVVITGADISVEAIGRGGGNFEILLPRDLVVEKGTEVTMPGINSYLLGVVEAVISSPRDAFQKILVVSPINIQELKFVQVEI